VYNHTKHTREGFKAALAESVNQSGWQKEEGEWRFYNGDTGLPIQNDWHHDIEKDLWYRFDGAGLMVTNKWYQYKGDWYYLNSDGVMLKGTLIAESGKVYCLDKDGKILVEPITLIPDQDGPCSIQN
jgi:glucan-binding YG repeat protein